MKKEVLLLNPKIYPLDVIYSAAYVLLEKGHFLLDEKDGKISVEMAAKGKEDIAALFKAQLVNYGLYKQQLQKAVKIKELMLEQVFSQFHYEEDHINDPEGIMIPWEEKYGPKTKRKTLRKKSS